MDIPNYTLGIAPPSQSFGQGYQLGASIRDDQAQQQQQQLAQQQAQQQQALLSGVANNPNATAADFTRVMLQVPSAKDAIDKAWGIANPAQQESKFSDLVQWKHAIDSGQPEVAIDAMNRRADAIEASNKGNPTSDSQAMRLHAQVIAAHPAFASGYMGSMLYAHPNAEKAGQARKAFGDEDRSEALAPDIARRTAADASKAESDAIIARNTIPANIQAAELKNKEIQSPIDDRASRLGLDRDKLTSSTQLELAKLADKNSQLPEYTAKSINTAVTDSVASRQSATSMFGLATKLDATGGGYGGFSTANEWGGFNRSTQHT